MPDTSSIAARVLDALVAAGLVTADQLVAVRMSESDEGAVGRTLIERQLITPTQLAKVLEDDLGFPRVDLESYSPDADALEVVPASIARARSFLPLFEIEGTLTVAVGDPADVFMLDSIAAEIGYAIDAVLAEAPAVQESVLQYFGAEPVSVEPPVQLVEELDISIADFFELGSDAPVIVEAPVEPVYSQPSPVEMPQTVEQVVETATPMGASAVDLDVLAVADDRKVAVLVADILERAVDRGASRIHLLPYKNDFFLVFRIKGRLEKIASAPLSMQQPLIDGFKNYAKLAGGAPQRPTLGRVHADISGKQVVLTLSSVPTVAGQRLVISIAPVKPQPRDLGELGMPDAECRAMQAMVERGRGLVLVAAPVSGGRSSTYYALLQHAAQVGKTVYSVERSIEFEIPAVAQVLVNPGQAVAASSYFAAGMRQDTDVIAIDSLQSVEDVHQAIEAAGMGKLVIATYAGADIVSAVRRLLDLGAEPVSLASALTLGVGQRVVRTICGTCSTEESGSLAGRIPGAEPGIASRVGAGCTECAKTGFAGATGIFEVLPFTEPVRAVIARGGSADIIEAAANAAGMRPLLASGLAKVREGVVSAQELDRVLRFAQ